MTKSRELSDLPVLIPSSIGTADQVLQVNSDRSALEYASPLSAFTGLSDTPSSLSGQGGKTVAVNSGGSALEFVSSSGGIALTDLSVGSEGSASGDGSLSYNNSTGVFTYTPPVLTTTFTGLSDTPSSLSGQGGKSVAVNSGGTALEFVSGGGGGALTVLDSTTFSSYTTDIAFIDSSSTWSNYKSLRLIARDVRADWNGPIYFSMGNGSYNTSSLMDGLRHQSSIGSGTGQQNISFAFNNSNHLELLQHVGGSGNTGDSWSGDWVIERHADSAVYTTIRGDGISQQNHLNQTARYDTIVGHLTSNQIIDRLRLRNGNGFTSGTVTLYGWKDS